jgi:aspartate/tyrosine/aromatic aminotransferase
MFENLPVAPPDSILGLAEAFQKDPRKDKINLSVGVYKDEAGATPILNTVKAAEAWLLNNEKSKGYLGIEGLPEYLSSVVELVLGGAVEASRVAAVQSPGGTGALRVASEMVANHFPKARIWISQPTWANHQAIFEAAGLQVEAYPYLAADKTSLDIEAMIHALETQTNPGDFICLHACCHNPTGIDPTLESWKRIAQVMATRNLVPFLDFAYQGFGDGLTEDAEGMRQLLALNPEAIVCASFSKNFGLYSERVGAAMVVTPDSKAAVATLSQLKQTVRANYSNPPRHGAAVVATILNNPEFRSQWISEVNGMRDRISQMRTDFVRGMQSTGIDRDFSFLLNQKGMFSYTGLNAMQADWLRSEKGIYIVGTGRVNVAGMASKTMPILCQAIADCIDATSPKAHVAG